MKMFHVKQGRITMQQFQLKDLPNGNLDFQNWRHTTPYLFTHIDDGSLEPISYYDRVNGTVVCGFDSLTTKTFHVTPQDNCYVFANDADRKQGLKDLRYDLARVRLERETARLFQLLRSPANTIKGGD